MVYLCRELAFSCLPNGSFPPQFPVDCRRKTAYCCITDFCNTVEKYQLLHASDLGKQPCTLARVISTYFEDANFEFV